MEKSVLTRYSCARRILRRIQYSRGESPSSVRNRRPRVDRPIRSSAARLPRSIGSASFFPSPVVPIPLPHCVLSGRGREMNREFPPSARSVPPHGRRYLPEEFRSSGSAPSVPPDSGSPDGKPETDSVPAVPPPDSVRRSPAPVSGTLSVCRLPRNSRGFPAESEELPPDEVESDISQIRIPVHPREEGRL